jgi:hypothetical protein
MTASQLQAVISRANGGDEAALGKLRPVLDLVPELADDLGNLARIARDSWLHRIAPEQLAFRESLKRKTEMVRDDLVQPTDGPMERLLAERVALCWLHLHYAEGVYARNMETLDIEWSDHYQRRIDRAQRRYLQAIRTLAQVRRLAVPSVQVNIAEHQVNQMSGDMRTVA